MARPVDYYEILQVSPSADDEIIQAAFRYLALKWHPERCPGDPTAAERMKLINQAYAVLSDPHQRREYDRRRRPASPRLENNPRTAAEGEPRAAQPRETESDHGLRVYFRETSRVQNLAYWFIGLSLGDLLMTYALLRTGPRFYESNPVAQLFFQRWNILGMTLFKVAIVMVIVGLSEVIERRRPGWGRLILLGGSGAAAYAIVRGLRLYLSDA